MIAIFPQIATYAMQKDLEKLVVAVRTTYGGNHKFAPQMDMELLCANMGVKVQKTAMNYPGAVIVNDDKGQFSVTFCLQPSLVSTEARFLLAHLIGHYLLHIQPMVMRGEWTGQGFKELQSRQKSFANGTVDQRSQIKEREQDAEADRFAAALLIPVGLLKRAQEKQISAPELHVYFGVSEAVLQRRLENLGWVAVKPSNFLAAEAQLDTERPTKKSAPRVPDAATVQPDSAKIGKAQKVVGHASYRPQVTRENEKGMERIREIARKLDSQPK